MNHPSTAQTDLIMIAGQICVFGLLLCTAVLSTSVPAGRPGKCPPERLLAHNDFSKSKRCESDYNCEGNKKCCMDNGKKICKPPAQAGKPGHCPPERFLAETYFFGKICESDSNCEGKQKCCMDNGDKFCKSPAQERPGTCPYGTNLPRATDFCTSDSECADGSKCCFNDGGKTCLPFVKEKMGSCPPRNIIYCFVPVRNTCTSDSTCPGDYKCCPSGCHRECLKAV
ncbi:perlwapin-like isoform X3 [Xenopus laevis]|uniref:Perlwapin-like isoform X3 n=1 Tax=Xenopus laevis TaxID=8355 RepID=A0A8J1LW23_XENLA|nr:perlwapin-like isoform X3 [Xenopus laevis]